MKRYFKLICFIVFLTGSMQLHAQEAVDSAAMIKSQKRIESNLKDANKLQGKIDKKQKRIEKPTKKNRQESKKKRKKMNRIEKEQKKLNSGS